MHSSWPGKSAKRVFAQTSRPSTSCGATERKGVDARDKPGHNGFCLSDALHLRPYRPEDEDAAIALWLETWQKAYPAIDFAARVPWWRERWRNELVPKASIIVAEAAGALTGFVTIDASGYLDQLVVAPDRWGSDIATRLLDETKRLSPDRITLLVNQDNARAIGFYRRNGFVDAGEDVNPTSGRPVKRMEWTG
jgi:putative acetyltransferase